MALSACVNAGGTARCYFVIDNPITQCDELLSASKEVAGAAEFYRSVMDTNEVMSM